MHQPACLEVSWSGFNSECLRRRRGRFDEAYPCPEGTAIALGLRQFAACVASLRCPCISSTSIAASLSMLLEQPSEAIYRTCFSATSVVFEVSDAFPEASTFEELKVDGLVLTSGCVCNVP